MATPGRKPGYKHTDEARDRIKAGMIVKRLMDHINAKDEQMTMSQVNAAKALLNKVLPDLKAIELTGENGGPVQIQAIVRKIVDPAK